MPMIVFDKLREYLENLEAGKNENITIMLWLTKHFVKRVDDLKEITEKMGGSMINYKWIKALYPLDMTVIPLHADKILKENIIFFYWIAHKHWAPALSIPYKKWKTLLKELENRRCWFFQHVVVKKTDLKAN